MSEQKRIIVFDGYCNFCSRSVLFIIKRDRDARFLFTPSQSPVGKKILAENGIAGMEAHSIILIESDRFYRKSEAALRITRRLDGIWPVFYAFIILPRGVRDFIYDRVARNRYRIFGTREKCFLPSGNIAERFLRE
jgi:predicted DCC family thiol-disulfide oxidoreductase YuxK